MHPFFHRLQMQRRQTLLSSTRSTSPVLLGRSQRLAISTRRYLLRWRRSEFNEQNLARAAWAFAKAGQSDASLLFALAEVVKLKLGEFNAQEITNTTWALTKAGQSNASLSTALSEAAKLKTSRRTGKSRRKG